MPINLNSVFGVHEQAMLLFAKRSEVLAKNLANSDTPDFKARDIDFRSVLGQAAGDATGTLQMAATEPGHIQPGGGAADPPLLYRIPTQPSADGNTVENQIEQAQFSENALRYQASFTFLSGNIKGMLTAIKGQ